MRRDWRGPSSSSTISSVRRRAPLAEGGGAMVLKGVSKGDSDGMAEEFITAIGGCVVGGRRVADVPRRTPGELVGGVAVELLVTFSHAQTEDVPIGIRHGRIETRFRDGVLAVNITAADLEAVAQIAGHAHLVQETRAPIERQWLSNGPRT